METPAVFISYSTPDQSTALLVCRALENAGIRCWIAPRDIPAGGNAFSAIPAGLQTVSVLVLILSGTTSNSQYVQREVQLALDYQKHIIPFRIENVLPDGSIHFMLTGVQWLDAYMPPVENHIANLVSQISALLNASPSRPVTAAAPSRHFPFKWLAIAATAIAVLAAGAFAFLHSRRSGPNDASIQAAVIQRLQAALGPGGVKTECTTCRDPDLFVNVLVQHSAVVLSGVLPAESIDASIQLTRGIDGVSDVSSVLRPPSTPANASAATPPTPKLAARTAQPSGSTGNTGPTHPAATTQHTGSDSSSTANVSADSLRARAFVITGREKMKQANYESARANFEQALNLDPDNEAARSGLAAANKALGDQ